MEYKNNQLDNEYSKLIEIQGFHLGRNQFEKEQQIVEQVRIIKGLKHEIAFYEKLINQN